MTESSASPVKVLVVDDHRSYAEALSLAVSIEPGFHSVGSVPDVESAIAAVRQHEPDVVIIDWQLPEVDGVEGVRHLLLTDPRLKVIMITGHAESSLRRLAAMAGASAFLAKESSIAEILQSVNAGISQGRGQAYTFEEFVNRVYLPVWRGKWKVSTAMTEEARVQVHLIPPLGPDLMQEISRERLQRLLKQKAASLSQSGVDHLRFRLRSIFELAVSEFAVDRNPATTLFTPKDCQPDRDRRVMTIEQAQQMIRALGPRERLIARLATWEGMRPGEILALQVGDIQAESVLVQRRLYKHNLDTPKTKRSIREVALTKGSISALIDWLDRLEPKNLEAWLFPNESLDKPILKDNIWTRKFRPQLKAIGLEWVNFQVMRRTFATLSKQVSVDAHTRSAQMGNSVDVNENVYAVTRLEDKLAAVRKLETVVGDGAGGAEEASED